MAWLTESLPGDDKTVVFAPNTAQQMREGTPKKEAYFPHSISGEAGAVLVIDVVGIVVVVALATSEKQQRNSNG